jgi:hypothetical protein
VAFYLAERAMGDAALIPLRLFRIRAAAVTILASNRDRRGDVRRHPDPAALHADRARGLPTEAGLLMLPMSSG